MTLSSSASMGARTAPGVAGAHRDVAQYVITGSALDLEARLRGTSVYFPIAQSPCFPRNF